MVAGVAAGSVVVVGAVAFVAVLAVVFVAVTAAGSDMEGDLDMADSGMASDLVSA
jgi:hypothetical protein